MEIFTGIDIVENRRIKDAIDKYGNRFLSKIFTNHEISYCSCKKNLHECLSARFAAKEAFKKAFFQAFKINLFFKEIEITGRKNLPAEISLHLSKEKASLIKTPFKSSVSISHERQFSVAVVVLYIDKMQ